MTADPAQILSLPIAEIDPTALIRDRTRLNEEALAELMISIAGTGLRQPIEVWAFPEPFESLRYGLISGARRLTACQRLGHTHISAFLRTPKSMPEAMADMIAENDVREDLSPWERGRILNRAVQSEMFGTLDEALKALHRGASKQKRSRLRACASVSEQLEGRIATPEQLTENQVLRLASALNNGFGELIDLTLHERRGRNLQDQWSALLPLLAESDLNEEVIPATPTRPARPRRLLTLRQGLTIRREMSSSGWILRFSGPEARRRGLMDDVMDQIEHWFQKEE
jgi:ParB family chromosome partitioning protein